MTRILHPVVWTVTGARGGAGPRRHPSAALVGGVAGGVTGVAAIVGLFLYAFSNWGG
jgi:hypothetical protein